MASKERQAEETRIRRILGITSFDLANLENYLAQNGHVPDSTDEQAVRDAVLAFRGLYVTSPPRLQAPLGFLDSIFAASVDPDQVTGMTYAQREVVYRESESKKYDAVRDLIRMFVVRKAQASTAQQQQETQGLDAVVKEEGA